VDVWLRQFAWVRALCEAARRLHAAGHFSFLPHYHYEYTLLVSLVLCLLLIERLWHPSTRSVRQTSLTRGPTCAT
jgi:hypothetical protein